MTTTDRPSLGPVKVGDELIVIPRPNRHADTIPVSVRVTNAGRVWLTLREIDGPAVRPREYRMRRDTQDGADGYNWADRFVTAEQLAWEQRRNAAHQLLRDQGISVDSGSPWRGREQELAEIIRAALPTEG